jgi:hypothetical protein
MEDADGGCGFGARLPHAKGGGVRQISEEPVDPLAVQLDVSLTEIVQRHDDRSSRLANSGCSTWPPERSRC